MSYNKLKKLTFLLVFPLIQVQGCSTTKPAFPKNYVKRKASKSPPSNREHLAKQGEKIEKSEASSAIPLQSLYKRFVSKSYELDDNDLNAIAAIKTPPYVGSLEEAVVVLANLRYVLQNSEFGGAEGQVRTIEEQFKATGIDPSDAFDLNPHLQGLEVSRILQLALSKSSDSVKFRETLADIVDAKSKQWVELAQEFKNSSSSGSSSGGTTASISSVDPSQYRAADLLLGDNILLQAQKLAEKGRFKSAINRAERVPNQDPYFPAAREKIKHFSNLAVQDLRQRAAQAFQSSLPVVDIKTKAAYLEEAKKYLEEALNDFPAADHLTTVRENLAVITKDLESITQETTR